MEVRCRFLNVHLLLLSLVHSSPIIANFFTARPIARTVSAHVHSSHDLTLVFSALDLSFVRSSPSQSTLTFITSQFIRCISEFATQSEIDKNGFLKLGQRQVMYGLRH